MKKMKLKDVGVLLVVVVLMAGFSFGCTTLPPMTQDINLNIPSGKTTTAKAMNTGMGGIATAIANGPETAALAINTGISGLAEATASLNDPNTVAINIAHGATTTAATKAINRSSQDESNGDTWQQVSGKWSSDKKPVVSHHSPSTKKRFIEGDEWQQIFGQWSSTKEGEVVDH